jgi:basic membrane lipoprotein Med (substrate-binding protein (PBP1-ABC) superfamily)
LQTRKKLKTLFCTFDTSRDGGWNLSENEDAKRVDKSGEVEDETWKRRGKKKGEIEETRAIQKSACRLVILLASLKPYIGLL